MVAIFSSMLILLIDTFDMACLIFFLDNAAYFAVITLLKGIVEQIYQQIPLNLGGQTT